VSAPLAGLRVVELARVLAGPWIGQTLADLGADVVKVEAPEGDETRRWGPPFVHAADGAQLDAAYFHACNRGKRSVVADLRDAEQRALVRRLIERADVVIENFRTGGLARFGLDYATLAAHHPRLVYCSITGFGQTGPYAGRAGYDAIVQGMCGLMDLTGEPDGAPQKIGVALVDIMTGLYGTIAIQAALAQRAHSGRGQHLDLALFDVGAAVLANQALNYLVSGEVPRRLGNAHPNIVPYQSFAAADGHLMLAVGNDAQFRRLCEVLGRPQIAADARYADNAARVRERAVLVPALSALIAAWRRDALLERLEAAGVPAGPINTVAEVFRDPQILHRKLLHELAAPELAGGRVPSVRTPIGFSAAQLMLGRPAPRLGQHTAEVMAEWSAPAAPPEC
jgi:crotonobetainyl-CoA:carnitine CoA-transferase CaiB-like acyl-CoA transferase